MRSAENDFDRSSGAGLSLTNVRQAIRRRLLLVLLLPPAFMAVAGVASLVVPESFEATAILQVDARAQAVAGDKADTATVRAETRPIKMQVARLRSQAVLSEVARREALTGDPEFSASPLTRRVRSFFGLEASPIEFVERSLWRHLSISEMRKTNIVLVRFTSRDPDKAAHIANAVVDAYLKLDAAEKWRATVSAPAGGAKSSLSQRTFEGLLSRFGLSAQIANARVLSRAEPPQVAANPIRPKWLAIAAAISLILSIGVALLLEATSLMAPRRACAMGPLSCDALSTLPAIAEADLAGFGTARIVVAEPECAYARAIGDTVQELQRRIRERSVLLVTSSVGGEGSEHVASNIAHHLALRGDRTLLVDGDMRSRLLTRQLQAETTRGLFDQLAMDGDLDDAVLLDGSTGLHFLPASGRAAAPAATPHSITPSDALKSARFDAGLASLRRRFDTIVVCAPPLLPVIDGKLIAERADHIVFVTSPRVTERQTAEAALRTLGRLRDKVSGAVVIEDTVDPEASVMGLAELLNEARQAVGLIRTSLHAA